MKAEVLLRTHKSDSGEYPMMVVVPPKDMPTATEYWLMQIQLEIRVFLGFALKILSWKTCHWSVINSTGASPDVDQRTAKLDTESTRNTLMAAPKTRADSATITNIRSKQINTRCKSAKLS